MARTSAGVAVWEERQYEAKGRMARRTLKRAEPLRMAGDSGESGFERQKLRKAAISGTALDR
jgi:hypothetical protein